MTNKTLPSAALLALSMIAVAHAGGPHDGYYQLGPAEAKQFISVIQDGPRVGVLLILTGAATNNFVAAGVGEPIGADHYRGQLTTGDGQFLREFELIFVDGDRCFFTFASLSFVPCVRLWGATPSP